ncbi:hypothetical protein [Sorangium sp. So ce388]|uniref:hypothetical protein n=1 Tax=Sorangium sp. So ce388 TaxID=3133309 RepID=UPI003F5C09FC
MRALILFAALALLALAGCAGSQPQAQTADAFADADEAIAAAAVAIAEGHKMLAALHDAERARIEATAPDAETGHRQIAELHARYLPAWDAYDALKAGYVLARVTIETARAAVAAGRKPNGLVIGQAIVRLAVAAEDLWRAIEALAERPAPAKVPPRPAPPAPVTSPRPAGEAVS